MADASRASSRSLYRREDGVDSPIVGAHNLMFTPETDINNLLDGYRQEEAIDLFQITSEQYTADQDAEIRGTANPSVMNKPFWMFQVGPGGLPAWSARTKFGNVEEDTLSNPVWCFTRFGATRTKLPDGRVVCIGGEHEDFYDPDFCIYNDVVVFDAPQKSEPPPLLTPESIKIYGYPVDIFPPLDFHTSTYFADPTTGKESLIIIGGIGYAGQTSRHQTDVYQLDLTDFSIHRIETTGAGPDGGTDHHEAEFVIEQEQAVIKITKKECKGSVGAEEEDDFPFGGTFIVREESGGSTAPDISQVSGLPEDTNSIPYEQKEGPIAPSKGKSELITTGGSKVFKLRIHDMRWI